MRLAAEGAAHEDARLRAAQAQKIEAIGELTGGIAHDFNNLLTVMSGGLYLLPRAASDPARCAQLIRRMEGAVGRGTAVTRCLLAFARRQLLRPERIDLAARADALRSLLTPMLGAEVALRLRFAADLWPIVADPAALDLSLLHIAENAREAMPHGGGFTLSAGNRHLEPAGGGAGRTGGGRLCRAALRRHRRGHGARRCWRMCSSRSSPPSRSAGATGWGCRRCTASPHSPAARHWWRAAPAAAPP